jgi:GT2 family glycosyltransferase
MISVCVAIWRDHDPPNVRMLAEALPAALDGEDGELVVALNGVDGSASPPGARSVDLGRNRGVAPAWNAAAQAAAGEVLVFANDDLVPGPGAIAALAHAVTAAPATGVAGVDEARLGLLAPTPHAHADRDQGLASVEALRGPLLAVRRDVFDAVGGFDEAYAPCLWEEVDLCLAVRAAGWECVIVEGLAFAHRPGISGRRAWPWVRVRFDGRSESLRSIRRRNRRRLDAKWGGH